jgi:hypothetical protein
MKPDVVIHDQKPRLLFRDMTPRKWIPLRAIWAMDREKISTVWEFAVFETPDYGLLKGTIRNFAITAK